LKKINNKLKGLINMMGFGYGMMGGFGLVPLILIGLVVYAVIKMSQGNHRGFSIHGNDNDALEILNRRYANGEISDEEYAKKKKILGGQ
jgi:putative membrane protein